MGIGPSEPKCTIFCARHFFKCLPIACTKAFTVELTNVTRLWDLNKKKVGELLYLLVFVRLSGEHMYFVNNVQLLY